MVEDGSGSGPMVIWIKFKYICVVILRSQRKIYIYMILSIFCIVTIVVYHGRTTRGTVIKAARLPPKTHSPKLFFQENTITLIKAYYALSMLIGARGFSPQLSFKPCSNRLNRSSNSFEGCSDMNFMSRMKGVG